MFKQRRGFFKSTQAAVNSVQYFLTAQLLPAHLVYKVS